MINPSQRLVDFHDIQQILREISRFMDAEGGQETAAQKLAQNPGQLFLQYFITNRASRENDVRVFEIVDDLQLCIKIAEAIKDEKIRRSGVTS